MALRTLASRLRPRMAAPRLSPMPTTHQWLSTDGGGGGGGGDDTPSGGPSVIALKNLPFAADSKAVGALLATMELPKPEQVPAHSVVAPTRPAQPAAVQAAPPCRSCHRPAVAQAVANSRAATLRPPADRHAVNPQRQAQGLGVPLLRAVGGRRRGRLKAGGPPVGREEAEGSPPNRTLILHRRFLVPPVRPAGPSAPPAPPAHRPTGPPTHRPTDPPTAGRSLGEPPPTLTHRGQRRRRRHRRRLWRWTRSTSCAWNFSRTATRVSRLRGLEWRAAGGGDA